MKAETLHRIPSADPVSGGNLYVAELRNDESGISIRGQFELPPYARLDDEQAKFLETFLRCRGMLNGVERELGISYPTAKNRLDQILQTLGFQPTRESDEAESRSVPKTNPERARILEQLESGEITAEEAKSQLGNNR